MFQDEYLEWSVLRDRETEDIQHAVFTCEGPEVGTRSFPVRISNIGTSTGKFTPAIKRKTS